MNLDQWVEENKLIISGIKNQTFQIEGFGSFLIVKSKRILDEDDIIKEILFDKSFNLVLNEEELLEEVDNYCFEFGGYWYYIEKSEYKKPQLKPLKYLGIKQGSNYFNLGIHGKYEILNGSGEYHSWCKKANFLGHDTLGICEKDTLAGVVAFQQACEIAKIKPIIGESITVLVDDFKYNGKVYVVNKVGWRNILAINKEINVISDNHTILEEDLLKYGEGLIFIFGNDYPLNEERIVSYSTKFDQVYYQIDSVIWDNDRTDINYLNNIKHFLNHWHNQVPMVSICDSYYLDKNNWKIKRILNKISKNQFQNDSKDQYYKDELESFANFQQLFNDDLKFDKFKQECIVNLNKIRSICEFKLELGVFKLPKFSMAHLPEKYQLGNNSDLFYHLLEKQLIKKGLNNKKYIDRLEVEIDVVMRGNLIDYFLILWDIVRWCKDNNILTGIGRGSAAGCLIAYLLDIVRVDPLEYGLLFERFLNEGRLNKSLPDIDMDFPGKERENVKEYIESLYGKNFVCSIGSYNQIKIKSGIKDLSRLKGLNFAKTNILTSILSFKEGRDGKFEEIFRVAQNVPFFKNFIIENTQLINELSHLLESPKSPKVHPCATIILPSDGEDIYSSIPVRKDGDLLISEWEGDFLEAMGYLKEDILGIAQLDKLQSILKLIKDTTGENIDIYSIKLDDINVMRYFQMGWTSDIFQFGSSGLTNFCKEVQPYNVTELTNMVALFRPGPIQSGAHNKYVNIKFGKEKPEYDFGLEKVTSETFGLYIFQEQVMKACQVLGGFNPVDTDNIRKAMGKKINSLIMKFKVQFIDNAEKMGCSNEEAENIWHKFEVFSDYGFNKSHAVCYAITGYISQWLKVYYPIQFWTTALQFAETDEDILRYMSEMKKTQNQIEIVPPDINNSDEGFRANFETKKIYWSLSRIHQLGKVNLGIIFTERETNGHFYSLVEFLKRCPVDRRIARNLVLSGAFDEIEKINDVRDREDLIHYLNSVYNLDNDSDLVLTSQFKNQKWIWVRYQKDLSGLGIIDYKTLIIHSGELNPYKLVFREGVEIQKEDPDSKVSFGGIINKITLRSSKKGPWAIIELDSNDEKLYIYCWNKQWEEYKYLFKKPEDRILLGYGVVRYDTYKKQNVIHLSYQSKIQII